MQLGFLAQLHFFFRMLRRQQMINSYPRRAPLHVAGIACLFQIGSKLLVSHTLLLLQELQDGLALSFQSFQMRKQFVQDFLHCLVVHAASTRTCGFAPSK